MGKWRGGRYLGLVLFGFLATGCGSARDSCESLCHWLDRCAGDDVSVSCSDSQIDACVDNYHDLDGDCQDAYDDFAECLDDTNKCEDAASECTDEAKTVQTECAGQL